VKSRAIALSLCFLALACESQLPGPIECEGMAYTVLGRSPAEAAHSPKLKRVADRIIQGCLTVPFDRAALSCAQSGQPFLGCVEALARRAPQRKSALEGLLRDVERLGARP
jgi:hypothetical protein